MADNFLVSRQTDLKDTLEEHICINREIYNQNSHKKICTLLDIRTCKATIIKILGIEINVYVSQWNRTNIQRYQTIVDI